VYRILHKYLWTTKKWNESAFKRYLCDCMQRFVNRPPDSFCLYTSCKSTWLTLLTRLAPYLHTYAQYRERTDQNSEYFGKSVHSSHSLLICYLACSPRVLTFLHLRQPIFPFEKIIQGYMTSKVILLLNRPTWRCSRMNRLRWMFTRIRNFIGCIKISVWQTNRTGF
jgi:hypothetical protein